MSATVGSSPKIIFLICPDEELPFVMGLYPRLLESCEIVYSDPVRLYPLVESTPIDDLPGVGLGSRVYLDRGDSSIISEVSLDAGFNEIHIVGPRSEYRDLFVRAITRLYRESARANVPMPDSSTKPSPRPPSKAKTTRTSLRASARRGEPSATFSKKTGRLFYAVWLGNASQDRVTQKLKTFWDDLLTVIGLQQTMSIVVRTVGASDGLTDIGKLDYGETQSIRGMRRLKGRPRPRVSGGFNVQRTFRALDDLLDRDLRTLKQLELEPARIDLVFLLGRTPGDDVEVLRALKEDHPELVITWVYEPYFEGQQLSPGLVGVGEVLQPHDWSKVDIGVALGLT